MCNGYKTGVECNNDEKCMVDTKNLSQCREVQPVEVIEDVSFLHMAFRLLLLLKMFQDHLQETAHLKQR